MIPNFAHIAAVIIWVMMNSLNQQDLFLRQFKGSQNQRGFYKVYIVGYYYWNMDFGSAKFGNNSNKSKR